MNMADLNPNWGAPDTSWLTTPGTGDYGPPTSLAGPNKFADWVSQKTAWPPKLAPAAPKFSPQPATGPYAPVPGTPGLAISEDPALVGGTNGGTAPAGIPQPPGNQPGATGGGGLLGGATNPAGILNGARNPGMPSVPLTVPGTQAALGSAGKAQQTLDQTGSFARRHLEQLASSPFATLADNIAMHNLSSQTQRAAKGMAANVMGDYFNRGQASGAESTTLGSALTAVQTQAASEIAKQQGEQIGNADQRRMEALKGLKEFMPDQAAIMGAQGEAGKTQAELAQAGPGMAAGWLAAQNSSQPITKQMVDEATKIDPTLGSTMRIAMLAGQTMGTFKDIYSSITGGMNETAQAKWGVRSGGFSGGEAEMGSRVNQQNASADEARARVSQIYGMLPLTEEDMKAGTREKMANAAMTEGLLGPTITKYLDEHNMSGFDLYSKTNLFPQVLDEAKQKVRAFMDSNNISEEQLKRDKRMLEPDVKHAWDIVTADEDDHLNKAFLLKKVNELLPYDIDEAKGRVQDYADQHNKSVEDLDRDQETLPWDIKLLKSRIQEYQDNHVISKDTHEDNLVKLGMDRTIARGLASTLANVDPANIRSVTRDGFTLAAPGTPDDQMDSITKANISVTDSINDRITAARSNIDSIYKSMVGVPVVNVGEKGRGVYYNTYIRPIQENQQIIDVGMEALSQSASYMQSAIDRESSPQGNKQGAGNSQSTDYSQGDTKDMYDRIYSNPSASLSDFLAASRDKNWPDELVASIFLQAHYRLQQQQQQQQQ
jgi:hypothetical protein